MAMLSLAGCAAEFLGMFLFVAICCGTATGVAGDDGWVQQVALTFGFTIFVLATALGRWGLQCNFAVTFGLMIAKFLGYGGMNPVQAMVNLVFQVAGSVCGALLVALIKEKDSDKTGTLGSNTLGADIGTGEALAGEALGTFLLMFVVMQAVAGPKNVTWPLAIGVAVYLAHSILIPVDGCSINPTRTIGPALVSTVFLDRVDDATWDKIWDDMWVFWLGPLVGAFLAVIFHEVMHRLPGQPDAAGTDEEKAASNEEKGKAAINEAATI